MRKTLFVPIPDEKYANKINLYSTAFPPPMQQKIRVFFAGGISPFSVAFSRLLFMIFCAFISRRGFTDARRSGDRRNNKKGKEFPA